MSRYSFLGSVVVFLLAATAAAETFMVTSGKPNRVRFESRATLETFDGTTDRIQGEVLLNPTALEDSIEVRLEVDLASLDTGIELRDKHMRENHLETKNYPTATFTGGRLHGLTRRDLRQGEASFEISGTLQLHGVSRVLRAAGTLDYDAAKGTLQVRCNFIVKLSEFNIKRPGFLVMKLDENQHVELQFSAQVAGQK